MSAMFERQWNTSNTDLDKLKLALEWSPFHQFLTFGGMFIADILRYIKLVLTISTD